MKKHLSTGKLQTEEVELGEGKYGAFRVGPKRPKHPYVPQGDQDPRTGLPLGFSPPPVKKDEPKDKKVNTQFDYDYAFVKVEPILLKKYAIL